MPLTEGLNLALMLAESGMIDSAVNEIMVRPQLLMAAEATLGIKASIQNQMLKWRAQMTRNLSKVSISENIQQEFKFYEQAKDWDEETFLAKSGDIVKSLEGRSNFYFKAKRLVDADYHKHNPMFQRYFCY